MAQTAFFKAILKFCTTNKILTHDIDVLKAKQTTTTNHDMGDISKVTTHRQNDITSKPADIA